MSPPIPDRGGARPAPQVQGRGQLALPPDLTPDAGWQRIGHYGRAGEAVREGADRLLAALGLLLLGPLLVLVAMAIRLESPGPAVVLQTRIGRGGRPFRLWRFRVFHPGRDRFGAPGPDAGDGAPPRGDPRLTRVGRLLRRADLDELPGLANVLLGDMSLVGPRPEIPELVPYYGAAARLVLSVRPGLTSLAHVASPEPATFQETLELDVRYVRERSLRLDAALLLATAWRGLTGRGPLTTGRAIRPR